MIILGQINFSELEQREFANYIKQVGSKKGLAKIKKAVKRGKISVDSPEYSRIYDKVETSSGRFLGNFAKKNNTHGTEELLTAAAGNKSALKTAQKIGEMPLPSELDSTLGALANAKNKKASRKIISNYYQKHPDVKKAYDATNSRIGN